MSARNLLQNYFPFFQQFSDAISFTRPSPLSFLQVFGGELALQRALTQETARLSSLNNLLSHRYASGSISGYKFRASWLKNPKRLVFFGLLLFSLQFRAEVLGNHPVPRQTVAAKSRDSIWRFTWHTNPFLQDGVLRQPCVRFEWATTYLHYIHCDDSYSSYRCFLLNFFKSWIWTIFLSEFIAKVRIWSEPQNCLVCSRITSLCCTLCVALFRSQRRLRINAECISSLIILHTLYSQVSSMYENVQASNNSHNSKF